MIIRINSHHHQDIFFFSGTAVWFVMFNSPNPSEVEDGIRVGLGVNEGIDINSNSNPPFMLDMEKGPKPGVLASKYRYIESSAIFFVLSLYQVVLSYL